MHVGTSYFFTLSLHRSTLAPVRPEGGWRESLINGNRGGGRRSTRPPHVKDNGPRRKGPTEVGNALSPGSFPISLASFYWRPRAEFPGPAGPRGPPSRGTIPPPGGTVWFGHLHHGRLGHRSGQWPRGCSLQGPLNSSVTSPPEERTALNPSGGQWHGHSIVSSSSGAAPVPLSGRMPHGSSSTISLVVVMGNPVPSGTNKNSRTTANL